MRQERRAGQRRISGAGVALLLGLGLIATACQSAPDALDPTEQSPAASPVSPADPEQSTQVGGGETAGATPVVASAAGSPTDQVKPTQPTAPTIRTELAATDPATVNFASGRPTLVEFFAFW